MKYSLVSREVIADSIEIVCRRQNARRRARRRRLRQEHARRHDGHGPARTSRPSSSTAAPSCPATCDGSDLNIVSIFEAVGQHSAGKIDARRAATRSSARPVPGAGSCGGMYTANTMSSAIEAMGMSLPYASTMAAERRRKGARAPPSPREVLVAADARRIAARARS